MAVSICQCMSLPVVDMQIIQNEWPSEFLDLYRDAYKTMLKTLHQRVKVFYDYLIQMQTERQDPNWIENNRNSTVHMPHSNLEEILNMNNNDSVDESSSKNSESCELQQVRIEEIKQDTIDAHQRVFDEMVRDMKDIGMFDAEAANIMQPNEEQNNEFTELIKAFEKRH